MDQNTKPYTIIDDFFCSTKTSPTEIQEFVTEDNKEIGTHYEMMHQRLMGN